MLHRNRNLKSDYHLGKWNGLGGKLEPDESALEAALRETKEESGLSTLRSSQLQLLGTLHFPHFKRKKAEDWLVWVFRAEISESQLQEVATQGPEGGLKWIPLSEVLELNLWAGDRKFLPKVLVGGTFWGTIWYEDERVIRAEVHPLS
jgi:8-oxo-dGTP diphosphatase